MSLTEEVKVRRQRIIDGIPGKVCGRIIIERVATSIESQLGGEQFGFIKSRGCMDILIL